jgi:hypothetical protein
MTRPRSRNPFAPSPVSVPKPPLHYSKPIDSTPSSYDDRPRSRTPPKQYSKLIDFTLPSSYDRPRSRTPPQPYSKPVEFRSQSLGYPERRTPSRQDTGPSSLPSAFTGPILQRKKSDGRHAHLAGLLANREDGQDTFGNMGLLRSGSWFHFADLVLTDT